MLKRFRDAYGNKFSYDESSYHGRKKPMKVHCNDCGEDFEITPEHHLKYNNGGCPNCHNYRIVKCSKCGKEMKVDRHVDLNGTIYCDECSHKYKQIRKNIKNKYKFNCCKICGRPLNDKLKCDNEFCQTNHYKTILILIDRFGFDKNKLGTIDVEDEFNRVRNLIYDMYWIKHMSSTEICKLCGYKSVHTLVNSLFKKLGILPKSLSQTSRENLEMGRRNIQNKPVNFKRYYHITWENNEVVFRSSYELDYANELDMKKIKYCYEKLSIKYFDS